MSAVSPSPSSTRRNVLAGSASVGAANLPSAHLAAAAAAGDTSSGQLLNEGGSSIAVSALPDEIYAALRSWTERAYPKLIYYKRPNKGGHFAVWEPPKIFSEEMRAAFKSLRQPT